MSVMRLFRCKSEQCWKEPDRMIKVSELAETPCPTCERHNWQRLTVIHILEENEDGPIKGSKHRPPGTRFGYLCDAANTKHKATGKQLIASFQPDAATCSACLEKAGFTINDDMSLESPPDDEV